MSSRASRQQHAQRVQGAGCRVREWEQLSRRLGVAARVLNSWQPAQLAACPACQPAQLSYSSLSAASLPSCHIEPASCQLSACPAGSLSSCQPASLPACPAVILQPASCHLSACPAASLPRYQLSAASLPSCQPSAAGKATGALAGGGMYTHCRESVQVAAKQLCQWRQPLVAFQG
jgi:hypothetical protein